MASHRPSQSISVPASAQQRQQRRMTSPAPPAHLNLPESVPVPSGRPPSPLRKSYTSGEDSQSDEEEDARWDDRRPSSPASSLSIASLAQAVGAFLGPGTPRSNRPTDAELEAEAARERDQSRLEAEWILTQEAEQRKVVEQRVLSMMQTNRSQQTQPLPPPPTRSQTASNPPSPVNSQKEGAGWWSAAKHKLTPTKEKEPLTPAQQIIHETKSRDQAAKKSEEQLRKTGEKEWKETEKRNSKGKERSWPASPETKFNDPAFLNLALPPRTPGAPGSPTSPTPARPQNLSHYSSNLSNFSPSPLRSGGEPSSPASQPVYAQFNSQGTLDMPGTLLTIARRFEKLEKWTVGHVRALEERMSDVERWLVDKEKEKESAPTAAVTTSSAPVASTENNTRLSNDVEELQGRVGELGREMQTRFGELGREMAKLATSPGNLSSGPSRQAAEVVRPEITTKSSFAPASSFVQAEEATSAPVPSPPLRHRLSSATALSETTSPPLASRSSASRSSRLPYPSGDYAPPDLDRALSPTNSPSPSNTLPPTRPLAITPRSSTGVSGLPSTSSTPSSSSSGLPAPEAPNGSSVSGLPVPFVPAPRPSSASPTPRKRYTVALGGPIVDPNEKYDAFPRPPSSVGTAIFSSSPADDYSSADDTDDESLKKKYEDASADFADETIGKSASRALSAKHKAPQADFASNGATRSSPSPSNPRVRAQSAYGASSFFNSTSSYPSLVQQQREPKTPTTPYRSRSTDRFSLNLDGMDSPSGAGKFIDPLVLRREGAAGNTKKMPPKGTGKLPVGQLVAFFDQSKA